ncbi:MAG: hypothetical protein JMN24_19010 [gamma proteobacterium endosymbiont of Lamellibrachia anaximandri]|nr:hypothetical protein [gamma proteobacterium endosymbiont of Lamellibrachia anaximandri]
MRNHIRIIDNSNVVKQNYFKVAWFRNEELKNQVSLLRWIWLCILEVMFGEELLENFVTTCPDNTSPEHKNGNNEYCMANMLNSHIPNGIFTNLFRRHLIELLYYKYYLQYLMIIPSSQDSVHVKGKTIDLTRSPFWFRKKLLYQVIAFRRVYILSAITLNLTVDVAVFIYSSDLAVTAMVAVSLEATRRLLKI